MPRDPLPSYVSIGSMRQRVLVQEMRSLPTGHFNETRESWETVGARWAAVGPAGASERDFAAQQQVQISHVVRMRYYAGLDGRIHRLVYKGRVLNIVGPINVDERNIEHRVFCREVEGEQP